MAMSYTVGQKDSKRGSITSVAGMFRNGSPVRKTYHENDVTFPLYYKSVVRGTTSTPLPGVRETPFNTSVSTIFSNQSADETALDLTIPKNRLDTPAGPAVFYKQEPFNSSYSPIDLRVSKLSDHMNESDNVNNHLERNKAEIEKKLPKESDKVINWFKWNDREIELEEDPTESGDADHRIERNEEKIEWEEEPEEEEDDFEGDPSLLNEFSINEYFENYRNMHSDDEEFPDSDDDMLNMQRGLKRKHRSRKQESEIAVELVEISGLYPLKISDNQEQEDNEDDMDNTTHHNLEKELVESKEKKMSLRTRNKYLRLKGMSYTRANGTVVPARSVKKGCDCRLKCSSRYSDAAREQLLRNLLALKRSGQNQFIANHMVVTKTARPKVVNSRRTFSRSYGLPGVTGMVKVCKLMFTATLDITDRKVRNLATKKIAGLGVATDDQREFNTANTKISKDHMDYIHRHIDSFPAYSSHYSREGSDKRYLSSDLSIKTLYSLYQEKCSKENTWIPVHYDTYRIIFKGKNLAFRKPKVDVCGVCEKFRIAVTGEKNCDTKNGLTTSHEQHLKAAHRVYDEKRQDRKLAKEDSNHRTVSFDLQKQLPTPDLRCGQAYYSRQLYSTI
ncbi:uncharacterized protein LOC134212769 [Armigeres subalbatus]|uniref:uncharacterized protein LOC134212769 n=1 Tax=Armigeres subalbatus TaxID=124917 RepID=UPI002ED0EB2D